jgi:HK97 gp10 family phage protein
VSHIKWTYDFDRFFSNSAKDLAQGYEDMAKDRVPVDSGDLKNSIKSSVSGLENKEIIVETDTGYGLYVEMGSAGRSAQPFLRRALNQTANILKRIKL